MNDVSYTIEQTDLMKAVRESAMLADVSISMWNAEKTDRDATEELKKQHGASGNIGRVVKNMLAGADAKLKEVRSAFSAVRTAHYNLTLPWVANPHAERQSGPRLLPTLLFQQYTGALSKGRWEAMNILDVFIEAYPNLIERARQNLGTLADTFYPTAENVKSQFRISFDFEPIPAGESFKGLPDHAIERLAAALQAKQQRMVGAATAAMWSEVKERVGHVVEKLADPEARFKSSTIANVRELITLLPGWDLANSSEGREVVQDIDNMLTGVDAKVLRDDLTTRSATAAKAQAVMEKLQRWGV